MMSLSYINVFLIYCLQYNWITPQLRINIVLMAINKIKITGKRNKIVGIMPRVAFNTNYSAKVSGIPRSDSVFFFISYHN